MLIVKIAKPAKVRIGNFPDAGTSHNAPSHPALFIQINLLGSQLSELRGGVVGRRLGANGPAARVLQIGRVGASLWSSEAAYFAVPMIQCRRKLGNPCQANG
jgi:hypothetical protein